jgi:hypothetical protein
MKDRQRSLLGAALTAFVLCLALLPTVAASGRSRSGIRLAGVTGLVVALVASAAILATGPSTQAAEPPGPLLNPANGHFYETVTVAGGINWFDAQVAAELRSFQGAPGHLVTITSAQEDEFIATNFPEAFPVIPDPRPPGCEGPLTTENTCGFPYWFGGFQPSESPNEPDGDWQWVTGEPFVYTNWSPDEPNDFDGREEDCVQPFPNEGPPTWNDSQCDDRRIGGYVVEYPHRGSFSDDDTSVFEPDIEWMAREGITKGCNPPTNDRYCPNANVTRGQMAAFLNRAFKFPPSDVDYFTDDNGTTFENDINAIAKAGITNGCNPPANDHFCPSGQVNRGQMAAFLNRTFKYPAATIDYFVDDNTSIFEPHINAIAKAGVTLGCNPPTNDKYCPAGNVTRGQMAAFLHRASG